MVKYKSIRAQYRRVKKKQRRKKIRQRLAKERDDKEQIELLGIKQGLPSYTMHLEQEEMDPVEAMEANELERSRLHDLWVEREKIALKEIKQRQEREIQIQAQREEEKLRIQSEFEKLQKIESDKRVNESALNEAISKLPDGNGPWHNPIISSAVSEATKAEKCQFFEKTGACRFGDRCSRSHDHPNASRTILIRGMFLNIGIEEMLRDEYDTDVGLEFEENELYQNFLDFYEDVLPEFKKIGCVVQFKVCCNYEPHLRGNVYVQYKTEEEAMEAFRIFNGRWYGGKILSCEFSSVTKWKSAICGTFLWNRCPKGRSCNFLHVFRNPGGEFRDADHDFFNFRQNHKRNVLRDRSRSPNEHSRNREHARYRNHHSSSRKSFLYCARQNSRSPENRKLNRKSRCQGSVERTKNYVQKSKRDDKLKEKKSSKRKLSKHLRKSKKKHGKKKSRSESSNSSVSSDEVWVEHEITKKVTTSDSKPN